MIVTILEIRQLTDSSRKCTVRSTALLLYKCQFQTTKHVCLFLHFHSKNKNTAVLSPILLWCKLSLFLFKWLLHQINPAVCVTKHWLPGRQKTKWSLGLITQQALFPAVGEVTGAPGQAPIWNNGTILPGVLGFVALACSASQTSITKLDSIPMTAEFKHLSHASLLLVLTTYHFKQNLI